MPLCISTVLHVSQVDSVVCLAAHLETAINSQHKRVDQGFFCLQFMFAAHKACNIITWLYLDLFIENDDCDNMAYVNIQC